LIDVQIVRAIYRACETGRTVPISTMHPTQRPEPAQVMQKPPAEEPELLHARMPSGAKKKG